MPFKGTSTCANSNPIKIWCKSLYGSAFLNFDCIVILGIHIFVTVGYFVHGLNKIDKTI